MVDDVPRYLDTAPEWRMDEWLLAPNICLFVACENPEIDERGPVWVWSPGGPLMRKACVEHWEGIYRVLGEQVSWAADAMGVEFTGGSS
jgi:hypothetical protein